MVMSAGSSRQAALRTKLRRGGPTTVALDIRYPSYRRLQQAWTRWAGSSCWRMQQRRVSPVIPGAAGRCAASGDAPDGGHHELRRVAPPLVRLPHLGSRHRPPSSLPQSVFCVWGEQRRPGLK